MREMSIIMYSGRFWNVQVVCQYQCIVFDECKSRWWLAVTLSHLTCYLLTYMKLGFIL